MFNILEVFYYQLKDGGIVYRYNLKPKYWVSNILSWVVYHMIITLFFLTSILKQVVFFVNIR